MTSPVAAAAVLPADYDPSRATVNASGTGKPTEMFDSEMFLNLLVAQLKYQDPTNPVDTSNFMNQTAMLSQVQTMNTMSTTLSEMMSAQQTASATSMLGKAIAFVDPSGNQVAGIVDTVSMNRGVAMLHVGDLAVPLAGVLAVGNPVPVDGSTGADDATGDSDGTTAVDGTDGATGTSGSTGADGATDAGSTDGGDATAPADDTTTTDDVAAPIEGLPDPAASDDAGGATDPTTAPTIRPDTISA